jgi:iron complex transport system substrate-binding protein
MGAYLSLLAAGPAPAALPTVASINLCTDQLVLTLAEPAQILSLSWLAADPEESMLADVAAAYPLNHGSAEELIELGPDVVIAGSETSPFTRQLLRRLGTAVVDIDAANSVDDIARNLRLVGMAIGREAQASGAIADMQARTAAIRVRRGPSPASAIVVRPGGFTIGRATLANDLLELAGLSNDVATLDRWGSLSIETLLTAQPDYVVITRYRADEASLANTIFAHPGLRTLAGSQKTLTVDSRFFACGAPPSLDAAATLIAQMTEQ